MGQHGGSVDGRAAAIWGGTALVVAAVSFMGVFGYLAATFDYPDVLAGSAADVLPSLLALGATGRSVWIVYALLPLLLVPGGLGVHAALRASAPNATRAAVVLATVAAMSMLVGLARWPTLHWQLALAWSAASSEARQAIAPMFDGLNLYLGTFIGEFVGEIALNGFFACSAYALLRGGSRLGGVAGFTAAALGLLAAFRNVTPAVAVVAEVDNYVLPIWLIVSGVLIARRSAAARTDPVPSSGGATVM
ncbi:MAG: hypothetical protein AB7T31_02750 [Gemmatimonadales bacterium]